MENVSSLLDMAITFLITVFWNHKLVSRNYGLFFFKASAKLPVTSSLNDHLLIAVKFNKYRFYYPNLSNTRYWVDGSQYRQILLNSFHRDFQRIIYRFSTNESPQNYRLLTVIYVDSSASAVSFYSHTLTINQRWQPRISSGSFCHLVVL